MENINPDILDSIINHFGGYAGLAKEMDLTRQAIYLWRSTGHVSARKAILIEELTCGKYKAVDIINLRG